MLLWQNLAVKRFLVVSEVGHLRGIGSHLSASTQRLYINCLYPGRSPFLMPICDKTDIVLSNLIDFKNSLIIHKEKTKESNI